MNNSGSVYTLKLKDLDKNLSFFLFDDYNYPIAKEIKQGINGILSEPIRLLQCVHATCEKNSKERPVFLDIGSNIGQFSMVCAAYGFKVYGFDADKNNILQAKKSAIANGFDCEFYHQAVSDKQGILSMNMEGPWACIYETNLSPVEYPDLPHSSWVIEATTIDKWWESADHPTISLVKMDVEGYETTALEGMKKTLESSNYPPIYAEFNIGCSPYNNISNQGFLEKFCELGYLPLLLKSRIRSGGVYSDVHYSASTDFGFNYTELENYLFLHKNSAIILDKLLISMPDKHLSEFLFEAINASSFYYLFGYAWTIAHELDSIAWGGRVEFLLLEKLISKVEDGLKDMTQNTSQYADVLTIIEKLKTKYQQIIRLEVEDIIK
jgi:FkbM family methyltransferase